ncbi:MAG: hypothetical protein WAT70_00615 [Rhizobiaceae bacterium]
MKPSITDRVACWSCAQWTAAKTGIATLAALGAAAWTGEGDWLILAAIFAGFGIVAAGLSLIAPPAGGSCNISERSDA